MTPASLPTNEFQKPAEKLSKTITQFTIFRMGVLFILTISFGHAFQKVGESKPQIETLTSKMDAIEGPLEQIEVFHSAQLFRIPFDAADSTDCSVSTISTPEATRAALGISQADLQAWNEDCGHVAEIYDKAFRLHLTLLGAEADFDLRSWIYIVPFLVLLSAVYLSILRKKRQLLVGVIAPRMLGAKPTEASLLDLTQSPHHDGRETAFDRFPGEFIRLVDVSVCVALFAYLLYSAQPIFDIWDGPAGWSGLGLLCVAIFYVTAYREYVARSLDAQIETLLSINLPKSKKWRFWERTSTVLWRVRRHASAKLCLPAGSALVLLTLLLPVCMVSCNKDQRSRSHINYGNGYQLIRGEGFWPGAFYLKNLGRVSDESEGFPSESAIARRSGRTTYIVAIALALLTLLIVLLRRQQLTAYAGSALFHFLFLTSLIVLLFVAADSAFTGLYIFLTPTNLYWVFVAYWLFGSTVAAGRVLAHTRAEERKWRGLASATFVLYTPLIVCSLFQVWLSIDDDWKNGVSILIYIIGVTLLCLGYAHCCDGGSGIADQFGDDPKKA